MIISVSFYLTANLSIFYFEDVLFCLYMHGLHSYLVLFYFFNLILFFNFVILFQKRNLFQIEMSTLKILLFIVLFVMFVRIAFLSFVQVSFVVFVFLILLALVTVFKKFICVFSSFYYKLLIVVCNCLFYLISKDPYQRLCIVILNLYVC